MGDPKESAIVKGLVSMGAKLVVEDLAKRFKEVESTPLGAFVRQSIKRSAELTEEGRPWTQQDVEELLGSLPGMGETEEDGGDSE